MWPERELWQKSAPTSNFPGAGGSRGGLGEFKKIKVSLSWVDRYNIAVEIDVSFSTLSVVTVNFSSGRWGRNSDWIWSPSPLLEWIVGYPCHLMGPVVIDDIV